MDMLIRSLQQASGDVVVVGNRPDAQRIAIERPDLVNGLVLAGLSAGRNGTMVFSPNAPGSTAARSG